MASALVQSPSPAPISFALNHPRSVKLFSSPLLAPRPVALSTSPAAAHSSFTPPPASHTSQRDAKIVVFPDDWPAASASADIDRLLSTAPTAIPRPIAFVQPQKQVNARPQHVTPHSTLSTPTSATPTAPPAASQRASSSPVFPILSAAAKHSHTNGVHTPLSAKPTLLAPALTSSPKLAPTLALKPSAHPADDNTFHPALHPLFSPQQLSAWSKWPASVKGPGTGLQNLGNTCFMNATLQALTHTPMLANYCLSRQHSQHCRIEQQKAPPPPPQPPVQHFGWRPNFQSLQHKQLPPFCLFCALEENIVRSLNQHASAFSPSAIYHRLQTISRSLRPGRQEDAHEFLRLAFDMLQSNVLAADLPSRSSSACSSSAGLKAPQPLPEGSSVPAGLFATLTPAQLHRIKETSVLYQIFSGYYRSTLTCRSCQQPSHTFEPFLDLSLSFPTSSSSTLQSSHGHSRFPPFYRPMSQPQQPQPPLTLHQCLRSFTSEEQLDTDNMYKCTACKKKTRASKRLSIHTAPNVLVVHLKRFEHSGLGMSGGGGKIGRMVKFETVLDVGQYMSEPGGAVVYELYGVLVHAGSTLYSGHYYSFVKAADGRWYEMNDSSVQPRRLEEVLAQKAYILFYTKKHVDTGVKGAAAAAGVTVEKQPVETVAEKREKVVAPLPVTNGAVRDRSANDMVKAMMAMPAAAKVPVVTPHLNGHAVKGASERKEQPSEKSMAEERKEVPSRMEQEEKQAAPVFLSALKPTERSEESKVAHSNKRDGEQKEEAREEKQQPPHAASSTLASSTNHNQSVRISVQAPTNSASTPSALSAHALTPLLLRQPGSPLSPPSTLSSPTSVGGTSKRKLLIVSSPPSLVSGMPSFRTGSQAKFAAFAASSSNGPVKKAKRELTGNGVGSGIRSLVAYSSSSDDEQQQDEEKAAHNMPSRGPAEAAEESKVEHAEESVQSAPTEEKSAAVPSITPAPPAPTSAPIEEHKSEPQYAENQDRKRRRFDVPPSTAAAASLSSGAVRFDPHAGRHTAHSHYSSNVGTWENDEKGAGVEQERRERDELLRRLERERRGHGKDAYDVMYDEGKKRKVRGEKDEWRGVAVKSGENLLQREQDRREDRGGRHDEWRRDDDRRHSDGRGRHSGGDRRHSSGSHHHHRPDRDGSSGDRDRKHSSSHGSRRESQDSHRPHHHGRRDDRRDSSRQSSSHKR